LPDGIEEQYLLDAPPSFEEICSNVDKYLQASGTIRMCNSICRSFIGENIWTVLVYLGPRIRAELPEKAKECYGQFSIWGNLAMYYLKLQNTTSVKQK